MKNERKCPKCGGTDILKIMTDKVDRSGTRILCGVFSVVVVPRYVCCGCGYTEEWIAKEDIPKLRKAFGWREWTEQDW